MSLFRRLQGNLKSLLVPILCIGVSGALILIFRELSARASARAAQMQVEMNHQYDLFQAQLAENNDLLVQMQKRTLLSEDTRDNLNRLFTISQQDLLATQSALAAANATLTETQAALTEALKKPTSNDQTLVPVPGREQQELENCLQELASLKAAEQTTVQVLAIDKAHLDHMRLRLRDLVEGQELGRLAAPKPISLDARHGPQHPIADITLEDDSIDSQYDELSKRGLEFIRARIAERGVELIEMNDELRAIHQDMLTVEAEIMSAQSNSESDGSAKR